MAECSCVTILLIFTDSSVHLCAPDYEGSTEKDFIVLKQKNAFYVTEL